MSFLLRLITRLGLRWVIVSAIARFIARRFGRSTIERAGRDLEATAQEKLPAPVAKAVAALPAEALNVGGSAVVATRAARTAALTTRRATQVAASGTRRLGAATDAARQVRSQLRSETETSRRQLKAQYLAATEGADAATDALLDARPGAASHPHTDYDTKLDIDPHEAVPTPVDDGRRRFRRISTPAVNRRQRSYRPDPKPWD